MLPTSFRLSDRLRTALLGTGVTGEIKSHGSGDNLNAIRRLMASDDYVTFGIKAVNQAVKHKQITQSQVVDIMAASLGITAGRFQKPGPGYIDPSYTAARLRSMLDLIQTKAKAGSAFLLATSHPGSLLMYYSRLAEFIVQHRGKLCREPAAVKVGEYRWIDQINGVHVLSDMGSLLHTHDSAAFDTFLSRLPRLPDLVLADHGFAGAAINRGLTTIALHDVDDPGIPLAAHLGADVSLVPMNDNQLNLRSAAALEAVMNAQSAP